MVHRRCIALLAVWLVALLAPSAAAAAESKDEPAPDLVVTKISKPPASAFVGSKVTIVVKLRNKGAVKAGKSRVALYLARGKKRKAKDPRLRRAKVKALRQGKKTKAKLKVTLPGNTPPGKYRLFACADDTKKVQESKEGNCTRTRKFAITLRPIAPADPPRPAFSMVDGIDWGFTEDSAGKAVRARTQITATLRAGNGVAGAAGYTRSNVAPQPLLSGATTLLGFGTDLNDAQVTRRLPFAFPFGGIAEQSISVSTNGWALFGSPAANRWPNHHATDYRGASAAIGEFERGIMANWADLTVEDEGEGRGTVKEVIARDGSFVAFQWDVSHFGGNGKPRRTFQLVLFPDGRFRMDYPGTNAPAGRPTFVGYSLGTGPGSVHIVGSELSEVPSESLLFTPIPVPPSSPTAPGDATMTLPAGSSLISADPACALVLAPGPLTDGRVGCQIPPIGVGQQATRAITFAAPPDAPGQGEPANFRYSGTYAAGGATLTDGDEINALSPTLRALADITVTRQYIAPDPPELNVPAEFRVGMEAVGALDEPTLTLQLPANTTISSILIAGEAIPCGALEGSRITCKLPSGLRVTTVDIRVVPTAAAIGSKLSLDATLQALNGPTKSGAVESFQAVVP